MSLWGATVITSLMSAIPWVGQDIVEFIWGGFSVTNATLNRFFALHFVLPFVLAALALMHLIVLHDRAGSGNPLGISGNYDRLPFAPYYIFKDLITFFIFVLVLSMFVFFMPNLLGDSENYVMANPMQTPPAIVPEWYLLPFYAILRSIPNKLLGVIAMFSAILILLLMPFTDISRSRGSQFKPWSKVIFFTFVANFWILMELGAKHVESPFIEFGQISTVIYFAHFLIIVPFISLFENSLMELSRESYHYWNPLHYYPTMVLSGFMPSPILCAPKRSRASFKPGSELEAPSGSEDNGWVVHIKGTGPNTGLRAIANPENGVCREYDPVTEKLGPVYIRDGMKGLTPRHVEQHVKFTQAWYENIPQTKIQEDFSEDSDTRNPHGTNVAQGDNGDSGPSAGPSTGPSTGPSGGSSTGTSGGSSTGTSGGSSTGTSSTPSAGPTKGPSPDQSSPQSPDQSSPYPNPVSDSDPDSPIALSNPGSPTGHSRTAWPTVDQDLWPTDDTPSDVPYDIILLIEGLCGSHVSVWSCLFIIWFALVWGLRVKYFMHLYNNNKFIIKDLPVVWLLALKSYLYNHKKKITISLILILLSIGMFSASLSSLDPHIDTSIFTSSLLHCDAPRPWGIYFQDNATPQMEGLVELHDNILFYLVIILFGVGWLLMSTVKSYSNTESPISNKYLSHGTLIELIWTITPALILIFIAFPSFKLLYLMDEVNDPSMAVLAEGHQWYWSYQYPDFLNIDDEFIEFDSYLVPESDLEYGALRMLEVDNRLIMPELTHVRFVTTGADVIHSLACPALGIKCDAYPGRLNQTSLMISREGVYYGQCSEICGILHSSMPVVIESVSIGKFVTWLREQ